MSVDDEANERVIRHAELMAEAARDPQTVLRDGKKLQPLIDGVVIKDLTTHVDERGMLCELFDLRWPEYPDPFTYAYFITIRPGYVKGWNLHKEHEDRYTILQGEMEVVLYDTRPWSPTCGVINRIQMTHHRRQIMNVPKLVWHADQNIGTTDVVVVNFPTVAYSHESPDKYRLPIDTPLIPHSFGPTARGW